MAWSKLCPICRNFKIYRRTSWTCGGPPFVAVWRTLTGEQKTAYMEAAAGATELPQMTPDELTQWATEHKTTQSPLEKLEDSLKKNSPIWDLIKPKT